MSALVASLLAVGSAPAGAAEIKTGEDNKAEQSAKPDFSACVGEALDDHGFTDLGTLDTAADAINCLAYYKISAGKTADTFDPDTNVTRSQMALFLNAAASKAGVDLMGGDGDDDFDDIADLGENRQNAIKALARNGIMSGSGGNFRPHDDITRAEMAVALVELVKHTKPTLFHQTGSSKGQLDIDSSDLDWFADARRAVPVAVDTAISYAYELGITSGVGDGTSFNPSGSVPRRNMATFIMAALAHSNLRPAGTSVQSVSGTLTVSVRDADFKPVANEIVDAFYIADARANRAFDSDGMCRSAVTSIDMGDRCKIDVLDPATNADGDAQLEALTSEDIGKGVTVWVWTGDIGDKFDEDTTSVVKFNQVPVVTPSAATVIPTDPVTAGILISPSQALTPRARFGASVQFTGQLQYTDNRGTEDNAADDLRKNTAVGLDGKSGAQYDLTVAVYQDAVTAVTVDSATGLLTLTGAGGLVSRGGSEVLKTDSEGKITFSVTTSDPSATTDNDARTVVWVLKSGKNAPGTVADDPSTQADESASLHQMGWVVFAEAASAVTTVKVSAIKGYAEAPSSGNSVGNGVVVTALDQYGRPMRGQPITLASNMNEDANDDGDLDDDGDTKASVLPRSRHTASTGMVRITYSHIVTTLGREVITAKWEGDAAGATDTGCLNPNDGTGEPVNPDLGAIDADGLDRCGTAAVYWAKRATAAASLDGTDSATGTARAFPIIAGSLADDEVVVDQEGDASNTDWTPWIVRYDDNDIFLLGTNYVDIEAFETALGKILDPNNKDTQTDDGTLRWDSYDHDDEDDRTLFTLTVS